jgi:hypothetical protein
MVAWYATAITEQKRDEFYRGVIFSGGYVQCPDSAGAVVFWSSCLTERCLPLYSNTPNREQSRVLGVIDFRFHEGQTGGDIHENDSGEKNTIILLP